jgi:hypothetical protein
MVHLLIIQEFPCLLAAEDLVAQVMGDEKKGVQLGQVGRRDKGVEQVETKLMLLHCSKMQCWKLATQKLNVWH